MSGRRLLLSRVLFGLGCALLVAAGAMLVAAWTLPSVEFEDLARVVMAMLLAALAVVPFALALLAGRRQQMPRWMLVASWAGIAIGLVPAIAIVSVRL